MKRRLVLIPQRGSGAGVSEGGDKATFDLWIGTPGEPGTDISTHYMVRKPGTFFEVVANAKIPTWDEDLILDILKSIDQGLSWESILPQGQKLTIAKGYTRQVKLTAFAAAPNNAVAVDDWLGMDCLQGEGAESVSVVVRWR